MNVTMSIKWFRNALSIFLLFCFFLAAPQLFLIPPDISRILFFVALGLLITGFAIRRRDFLKNHPKAFTCLMALMLGFSMSFARFTEGDMARLKAHDPQAYLAKLKENGQDEQWLTELKNIDPAKYEAEKTKDIEDKRIRRATSIKTALADIRNLKSEEPKEIKNFESLQVSYVMLYVLAAIAQDKPGDMLDEETKNALTQLKMELPELQKKQFPKYRKQYAKQVDFAVWRSNADAYTSGSKNDTLVMVSTLFFDNANIAKIHEMIFKKVAALRFKRVIYKSFKDAEEGQAIDMKTPPDEMLVPDIEDVVEKAAGQ